MDFQDTSVEQSQHSDGTTAAGGKDQNKPKRKYSKTGCKECKRRKMKCDEGKPSCWHCHRLNKECVYEPVKYKKSNKLPVGQGPTTSPNTYKIITSSNDVPITYMSADPHLRTPITPPNFPNQYDSPLALPNILNHIPDSSLSYNHQFGLPFRPYINSISTNSGTVTVKSESPASSLQGSRSLPSSNPSESSPLPLDPLVNIPQYFNDELFVNNANVMAHNLNDLLNLRLEEALDLNHVPPPDKFMETSPFAFLKDYNAMTSSANLSVSSKRDPLKKDPLKKDLVPKIVSYNMRELTSVPQVLLESFNLGEPHQLYLEYFYRDFALIIFPFQQSESFNPVRDILLTLATKNAYLMSAILACGARSLIKLKPAPEHERAYFSYLSSCLASLSNILNSLKKKLLENVELLLLTILLLTSDNASSKNQSWRAHLRGAKDLLVLYAQAKKEPKTHASSLVFAFCATWYIAFEILAGSGGLPLGGTLDTEEEIDLLINQEEDENQYLRSQNLMILHNFNLFCGYTSTLTFLYRDLIKLINRTKKELATGERQPISAHETINLLTDLEHETLFSIVHPSGLVPETHYMHPKSNAQPPPGIEPLPQSAIGIAVQPDGTEKVYCWYDISQQANVRGAMLIIFTRILKIPIGSPFVDELVHDIISFMHFLDTENPPKVYHVMMLQSPMWEAGAYCTNLQDRKKVETFFDLSTEVGVGSAEYVLRSIKKRWASYDRQKNRNSSAEVADSVDDEEELDIVTY